jgi:hypothetical protein
MYYVLTKYLNWNIVYSGVQILAADLLPISDSQHLSIPFVYATLARLLPEYLT